MATTAISTTRTTAGTGYPYYASPVQNGMDGGYGGYGGSGGTAATVCTAV